MPLYEYTCKKCVKDFEELRSAKETSLPTCPFCGQKSVEKKISLTSFSLKGEGWYKDGYARPSENKGKKTSGTSD